MIRSLFPIVLVLLVLPIAVPANAQGLLSPVEAERIGLSELWHRQIGAIGGAAAIVDARIWVQKGITSEYVEVFTPAADQQPEAVVQRFLVSQADLNGQIVGMTEAQRQAKLLTLRLQRRAIQSETRSIQVDQVRLYTLTNDGGLTARDAETGDTLWSIRLGNPTFGYSPIGINDRFVSVLNGTSLYQVATVPQEVSTKSEEKLNVSAGWVSKPIQIAGVPLFGLVNSEEFVFTVTTQSAIESFLLGQPTIQPGFEKYYGKPSNHPSIYPRSNLMMWSTEKQFIYAATTDEQPHATFRLPSDGVIQGGFAAAANGRFYAASTGGRIYGIDAHDTGTVLWNDSLGEPFYGRPFVANQRVYIASGYGNLYALDANNGRKLWNQPAEGIESVFSQLGDQLIGRNRNSQLLIVSASSGEVTARLPNVFIDKVILNEDTDRFYLVGRGGMVQCLRPLESDLPKFCREIEKTEAAEPTDANPDAAPAAPSGATSDPFGAGSPPSQPSDPDADPFGADPFGGSDPFQ